MKNQSKLILWSIAMAAFLLFTPISQAALKFDDVTARRTTIEEQLKALDTPIKLKDMEDWGNMLAYYTKSKVLYLSTKEQNISYDEKGNIVAFLIGEMTELNGIYYPVMHGKNTDALIIKCYPDGSYGAFHAIAELSTGNQAPLEVQKKSADALQKLLKIQEDIKKESATGTYDAAKWTPILSAATNEYTAALTESSKYMVPHYDWKAVGQEIKIDLTRNSDEESKWLINRKSVILKARNLLQEVVNKRKALKAELAAINGTK